MGTREGRVNSRTPKMTKDIESPQWEGSGEQTSLWVLCPSKLPTRGQQEVFPFSAHHSPPTPCSSPCLPLSWSSPSIPPLTSFLLSSPLPSFLPSFRDPLPYFLHSPLSTPGSPSACPLLGSPSLSLCSYLCPAAAAAAAKSLRQQPTRLPCPWDSPGKNTGVGCHFLLQCMKVKSESEVTRLCPTLCDPVDCSPPGSCVHGISQARVLESAAIAFFIFMSYPRPIPHFFSLFIPPSTTTEICT